MNIIEKSIEIVKDVFSSLIYEISCKLQEWQIRCEIIKEKKKYVGRLESNELLYVPEEPDKELALRMVSYLKEHFPNGIETKLQELSIDERKDLICEIVEDTVELFDIDPVSFEIMYPTSREAFFACGCGFYKKSENLLCLNGAYLMDERLELVKEQIYTIFHELKHARQFAAIANEKNYGYSEEIIDAWKYNTIVYILPYESDEAYRKQALERDAFGFENYLRELFTNNS